MNDLEIKFVVLCNRLGKGKVDNFLRFISSIRFLAFFWGIAVAIGILKNPSIIKPFGEAVLIVTALHFSITEGLIKHLLLRIFPKRKRPYLSYPKLVKPIGRKFSDSSFPSSHMATTVAMLVVIVAFYPSLLWLALAGALVMAFSRLHNGMHYPSDVLVGIALGLTYGYVALYFI